MGKQSARLYYQGKDHKDIYFQGNYHRAMYVGKNKVWEKLYGRYTFQDTYDIDLIDLDESETIFKTEEYQIIERGFSVTAAIAFMKRKSDGKYFWAISNDLITWKIAKYTNYKYVSEDNVSYSGSVHFQKRDDGFFVFEKLYTSTTSVEDKLYYFEIEPGTNNCNISEINIEGCSIRYFPIAGASDYFYGMEYPEIQKINIVRISKNGEILRKTLGYPFDEFAWSVVPEFVVNYNHVHLFVSFHESGNVTFNIMHIDSMDTDYITTQFSTKISSYFGIGDLSYRITYDNYKIGIMLMKDNYKKMECYQINLNGQLLLSYRMEERKPITMPIYGHPFYDEFSVVLNPEDIGLPYDKYDNAILASNKPFNDGYVFFPNLVFYSSSSHLNNFISAYYSNETGFEQKCAIGICKKLGDDGNTSYKAKKIIVYIDNPFFLESENNFAIVTY